MAKKTVGIFLFFGALCICLATSASAKRQFLATENTYVYMDEIGDAHIAGASIPEQSNQSSQMLKETHVSGIEYMDISTERVIYIDQNKTLNCIGRYVDGKTHQTGIFSMESELLSSLRIDQHVMDASTGKDHILYVKKDGNLYAVGKNQYGQLGVGHTKSAKKPVLVKKDVLKVTAAGNASFAIDKQGVLYAWGQNQYGQLGTGNTKGLTQPKAILKNVVDVWSSGDHTFAKTKSSMIYVFGDNRNYQLGLGHRKPITAPTKLGMYQSASLSEGRSLLLDNEGKLFGVGKNDHYQLGTDKRSIIKALRLMAEDVSLFVSSNRFSIYDVKDQQCYHFAGYDPGRSYKKEEAASRAYELPSPQDAKAEKETVKAINTIEALSAAIESLPAESNPRSKVYIPRAITKDMSKKVYPAAYGGVYLDDNRVVLKLCVQNVSPEEIEQVQRMGHMFDVEIKEVDVSYNQLALIHDMIWYELMKYPALELQNIDMVLESIDVIHSQVEVGIYKLSAKKEKQLKQYLQNDPWIAYVDATYPIDD